MTSSAGQLRTSSGAGPNTTRRVQHRVVEMAALTAAEIERWLELRRTNPRLDSPYFHPGFAAAVAATRPGVRVIIEEDGEGGMSSFLPVQLDKRTSRPAGFPAADFQGPICPRELHFDVAGAIRSCGAHSYYFDHLLDGIAGFEPWIFDRQRSPYLDVTGGMDGYLSRASRSGKAKVGEADRLGRKAEREYGPLRFVANSRDSGLLDRVMQLKRQQYSRTGARDYFSTSEHVNLLRRLSAMDDTDFGGVLSAVYAGPHLLAAHFGLRAGPVLHWWFPVYDSAFSRLSPGWLLLCAMIRAAPDLGLERIDLGRGEDDFKRRAMTGYQVVCQGAVLRSRVRRRTMQARRRALVALKSSAVGPALRRAVRYARRRAR